MIVAIAAWWILVRVSGGPFDNVPRAFGPYPSQELCRLAGESAMPREERFWTAAHLAKDKAEKAARQKRRDDEIKTVPHDKDGWASLSDGTRVHFNKKGEIDSQGSTWIMDGTGPMFSPITGCVNVEQ